MPPSTSVVPGIDFGKLVYIPHPDDGFQLGKLVDIRSDGLAIELLGTRDVIQVSHDEVFPADDNQRRDVDDNCGLMYLNEATLLHNCQVRYKRKQIYTYVANILISINPYEQVPDLYSPSTIKSYCGKSLGTMPPHVFAIADMAYRDMKRLKISQSVVVSGESGAGKTESQKCILRYLCDCWGGNAGLLEQRLLETNPLLEAFGNAKTLRNNNSSRFGKFVEIHFNSKYTVAGGFVSHYLLEKSRLCHQSEGERNYHIFYQLLAGADPKTKNEYHLDAPSSFKYLAHGCTQYFADSSSKSKIASDRFGKTTAVLQDDLVDDYADYHRLRQALLDTGMSAQRRDDVFQVIAAVLHLGNVEFEDNVEDTKGGCMVTPRSEKSLAIAGKLLGIEPSELRSGLITRVMQPARGGAMGTMIRVPLKPREAANARDALAKAVYSRLFDEIVNCINNSIPFTDSTNYIGVLDIAGFEFFAVNSFEQFCINYCNEKLQQFFNERILKHEQDLYAQEGLNVPRVEYADNQDCIELFEDKPTGLLDLLDEEARLPKPSTQHYTDSVHRAHPNHFRLSSPRKSRLREHRDMRDDEGFLIRHYAGTVCYQTSQFLEKNNDALHMSLEMLMEMSTNGLITHLFQPSPEALKAAANPRNRGGNKLVIASASNKFRNQLEALLKKLRHTGTHFVRCIKPNSIMKPSKFDGAQILSQLKCAGMASVLKLMQKGYPSRTSFADLYEMYKELLPAKLKRLDPRLFTRCLFHALGLNDIDFKFGMTRVFFRPGKFAEFDSLMRQDKAHMTALIAKVSSWLNKMRWKKVQYGAWSVIKLDRKIKYRAAALTKIQSSVRGFITRKREAPRLSAYRRAMALQRRFNDLGPLGSKLSAKSKAQFVSKVQSFSAATKTLISTIQNSPRINTAELNQTFVKLDTELSTMMAEIKKQIAVDEEEKMRAMEAQLAAEKERQKAEAREKVAQEQKLKELRELEAQRQAEEEERQKRIRELEEEMAREASAAKAQDQQKEQERLDAELNRRLAMENRSHVVLEASPSRSQHAAMVNGNNNVQKDAKTHNLSGWTYAQLRDCINTSNNIELLQACRSELSRRLTQYHQWKALNSPAEPTNTNPFTRAPPSILSMAAAAAAMHPEASSSQLGIHRPIQRYFRVPFTAPGNLDNSVPAAKGLWYAHFDGQFIARQMEITQNRAPILLLAGRDDHMMCELTLEQTHLTRKKGAEILATEFEALWQRYGGAPYSHPPTAPPMIGAMPRR